MRPPTPTVACGGWTQRCSGGEPQGDGKAELHGRNTRTGDECPSPRVDAERLLVYKKKPDESRPAWFP